MAEYNSEAAAGRRTSTDGALRGHRSDDHVDIDPNNLLGGREDFATSANGEFQNKSAY